jgi:hypothetical protein
MKRKRTPSSQEPDFNSPQLREIAEAFLQRRQAIRYKAGFKLEREFIETHEGTTERLNLDLQADGQLRLSVWEDGEMWFGISVRAPGRNQGWAFQDNFHGSVLDVSAQTLVVMVEQSLAAGFRPGVTDRVEYREQMRAVWARVPPH